MEIPNTFPQELMTNKTLFVCNHSGGKDSQTMYLMLKKIIPQEQLIIVHAHLAEVEWEGTIEHIKNTIEPQHKLFVVQSRKTFFEMVEHRQMFPSSDKRQCTSDLKRAPIDKQIKAVCNEVTELTRNFDRVINCMGMRAEESTSRAKQPVFKKVEKECNSKRDWYAWLPIHHLKTTEVFDYIKQNNQEPHWIYSTGMSRCSCCFCIMANKKDLRIAAKLKPELYKKYVETEKRINHTLVMPVKGNKVWLSDIVEKE